MIHKPFLGSIAFLTRIHWFPSPRLTERERSYTLFWYPVVGLLTAGLCVGLYRWVFLELWNRPMAALLTLGVLVWTKDAFHLDGLADLVDGLYGGHNPEQRYAIMKDPHLGTMGGLALLGVLVLEAGVLLSLDPVPASRALLVALPLSTASAASLLCLNNPLPDREGLAAALIRPARTWVTVPVELVALLIALMVVGWTGLLLWLVGLAATGVFSCYCRDRLGGVNGDCCGALIMINQTLILLVFAMLFQTLQLNTTGPGGWLL